MKSKKVISEKKTWESSMIKSTTYNYDQKELLIEFNNGAEYVYNDFSSRKYNNFLNAESKGKYFLSKIKPDYNKSKNFDRV